MGPRCFDDSVRASALILDDPHLTPQSIGPASRGWRQSAGLALLRRGRLRVLALGDFLRSELRDAFDQLHGDGLGEWEADRALVDLVRCKVVLGRRDEGIGGGGERVVLPPPSEIEYGAALRVVR